MKRSTLLIGILAGFCSLAMAVGPAFGQPPNGSEHFTYEWTLGGFKGLMARLFIPGRGEGRLTAGPSQTSGESHRMVIELLISSKDGERGAFWLYGAEIDPAAQRTVRAWSAQRFRGRSQRKERDATGIDALDLASSIYYLRRELPTTVRETRIWSSGRLNPVVIRPLDSGSAVWKGEQVATRSFTIRGVHKPGQPFWKGRMDLVLTDDERALPLEIVVLRRGVRIRLELVAASDA